MLLHEKGVSHKRSKCLSRHPLIPVSYTHLVIVNVLLITFLQRFALFFVDVYKRQGQEHESNLDITGIPAGTYQVFVNGQTAGSFEAQNQTTTVALPIPEGDSAGIRIQPGELLNDTTPVVDAGEDTRVTMEEELSLIHI